MLFIKREQHPFFAHKLCMQNLAKINIKMHVCYRILDTNKQHRHAFYKAFHILFRPGKIFHKLQCMTEDIEQKKRHAAALFESYQYTHQTLYNHLLY